MRNKFGKLVIGAWLLFGYWCLVFGILSGCQIKEAAKSKEPETIPVRVLRVKLKDIHNLLEYAGDIKAQEEVLIFPKVSGKLIEKVKHDGESVNKGAPIAYIDRDEVGLTFEKAPVESSLSGVVGRVYVDIGANVNPQTPVALVVDMRKVKIDLDIPQNYIPKVSLGQEAKIYVDAYPEKEFIGTITKISPVLDLSTRSVPVEILINNSEQQLKSGMFAKVKLIIEEQKNAPVILKEAIIGKEPDTYVYVIENEKAFLRKIKLGLREGPYFAVDEGLKEGDAVVIMGQQRLRDASLVSVEERSQE